LFRITWEGAIIMCAVLQWSEILNEIEYLVFHNYNVFFLVGNFASPGIHVFFCLNSYHYYLLIYLCLLPSSATVKMDNGEHMENTR
jgi:hypothetical protein